MVIVLDLLGIKDYSRDMSKSQCLSLCATYAQYFCRGNASSKQLNFSTSVLMHQYTQSKFVNFNTDSSIHFKITDEVDLLAIWESCVCVHRSGANKDSECSA
ncbi:hypothetical protein KIL84_022538 [Mauremys mutica]|uniref:Uncharacterized protein n=1 Tax=Mauremys mutica TaxID=74926 RepID=A0A9D3WLP2_9SAUR|nr:hypothetical protein KIL84_022538 [Mauremys mutica]